MYEIKLRPLENKDLDHEYFSWFDNSDGHLNFYSGSKKIFNKETILANYHEGLNNKTWFYYLIETYDGNKIGNVKIGPIDYSNKTADLVSLIGNRNYLKKGLASKAIKLANEIAFHDYDLRRLQSGIHAANLSSVKAYTNADWVIEARLKGYYWVNGEAMDRICIACFNPLYFAEQTNTSYFKNIAQTTSQYLG